MLDFDKKHLLSSANNLTFDGSSIRGFSVLAESDLRIAPEWRTLRFLPSDIFGPGKVIMFGRILNRDFTPYLSDSRNLLQLYLKELKDKKALTVMMATEVEGFLVEGVDAEQNFETHKSFKLISTGGYFHSLPRDLLRQFIDTSAEAHRAMAFENEKDHPEVAPSQFELNFKYGEALEIADEIQLYKLVCRQVADSMGLTATFLPKPIAGINGSGMHTNLSIWKNAKNIFYAKKGESGLSPLAWQFINCLLNHAPELSLILNPSVNSYRRLDPHFEAPNQIKVSLTDRGSMIRIPIADESATRIEVRSIAPDANPYLVALALIKTGLEGMELKEDKEKRPRLRFLPGTITEAIKLFKAGEWMGKVFGEENKAKYASLKQLVADRSPKELGAIVKTSEVIHHHEVTNQVLWGRF
jgi:glutamine synthetase